MENLPIWRSICDIDWKFEIRASLPVNLLFLKKMEHKLLRVNIITLYPFLFSIWSHAFTSFIWGRRQLAMLLWSTLNFPIFERRRVFLFTGEWWREIEGLGFMVTGRYTTIVLPLTMSLCLQSSEKFKRVTWSGLNCSAPADNETSEVSMNV